MTKNAPLKKVYVADTVVRACLVHSFTTEQEEVMGLLLGEVVVHRGEGDTYKHASVWESWPLRRSVRRSDRVEIAPEFLAGAVEEAEGCTRLVGRHTRVIGWYHSHPRITPYPSEVDLRSQGSYQLMESGWVGLIFSVFYSDATNRNSLSIHCFQTGTSGEHRIVDLDIVSIEQMPLKALPQWDVTHRLLSVFRDELQVAVDMVKKQSNNSPAAMAAAHALKEVQFFSINSLIVKPTLEHLRLAISFLKDEEKRLITELAKLQS